MKTFATKGDKGGFYQWLFFVFMALSVLAYSGAAISAVAPDNLLEKVYGMKTTRGATLVGGQTAEMRINASSMRDPGLAVFKIGSTTMTYEYKGKVGSSYIYHIDVPESMAGYRTITAYTDHRGSIYNTTQTASNIDRNMVYSCTETTDVYCTNGKTVYDAAAKITKTYEGRILIAGEKDVLGAYQTLSGTYSMWVDQVYPEQRRMITLAPNPKMSQPWGGGPYQSGRSCIGGEDDESVCYDLRAYFPSEFGAWNEVNGNGFTVWKIDEDKSVNMSYYDPIHDLDNASRYVSISDVLSATNVSLASNGLPSGDFPSDATRTDYKVYVKAQVNSDYNDYLYVRLVIEGETVGCTPATTQSIGSCDSGERAVSSLLDSTSCLDSSSTQTFGNTVVPRPSSGCWTKTLNYSKEPVQICGTRGCNAVRLDTTPPSGEITSTSSCGGDVLGGPYETHYHGWDDQSGLRIDDQTFIDSLVTAVFADGTELVYPARSYDVEPVVPYTMVGLGAPYILAKPDLNYLTSALDNAFKDAYYNANGNGKSRKPFTIKAQIWDEDNHETIIAKTFESRAILDTTPPMGSIETLSGGTMLKDLADLKFRVEDSQSGVDPTDVQFFVEYGGRSAPFNMTLIRSGNLSTDACVARKPTYLEYTLDATNNIGTNGDTAPEIIAAATAKGQPFTVKAKVQDWAMNKKEIAKTFTFTPQLTNLTRRLPASSHEFSGSLDIPLSQIQTTFMGMPVASGTPRYYAYVQGGNQGATVNGKRVSGSTSVPLGSIVQSGGSLRFGLGSDRDALEGSTKLILIPGSTSYKKIVIDASFWAPQGNVTGTNFEPVKNYEEASYSVTTVDENECRFTGKVGSAKTANPLGNSPYCYVEWSLPNNLTAQESNTPTARGIFSKADANRLSYSMYLYEGNARYLVGTGSRNVNVKDVVEYGRHRVPGIRHVFEDTKLSFTSGQWARGQNLGEITYSARLLSDSEMLNLNGKNIANAVVDDVLKVTSPSSLNLAFGSAREFVDGHADVLLVPSAYPAHAIRINVDFWTQDAEMTGFNFEPVKLDEDVTYGVTHKDQVSCGLTGIADNSKASNLASNPICFVEWTKYPESLLPKLINTPTLGGVADKEGAHAVEFLVKAIDEDGSEHIVGRGSETLNVKDTVVYRDITAPALAHPFLTRNGRSPVNIDGEELVFIEHSAVVKYHARLLNADAVPLTVNGVDVAYGQDSVFGVIGYEGNQALNISTQENLKEGRSILLLIPDNYRAKAVKVTVDFWVPDASVKVENPNPVQLYEQVNGFAEQKKEGACGVTNSLSISKGADPFNGEAICYVKWTQLPVDVHPMNQNFPEFYGFTPDTGKKTIKYEYVMIDENGEEHFMAAGEKEIDIIPAKDVMKFDFTSLKETYRIIRTIRSDFTQTEGPVCGILTTNDVEAMDSSAINRPSCLIEWVKLPEGIEQSRFTEAPAIEGIFDIRHGDGEFEWQMYGYTTSGNKILIMDGGTVVPLLDPPPPVIEFSKDNEVRVEIPGEEGEEVIYVQEDIPRSWYSRTGGLVGDFSVKALSAEIGIIVLKDNEDYQKSNLYGSEVDEIVDFRGYIFPKDEAPDAWEKNLFRVEAFYRAIPDIRTSSEHYYFAVPSETIRPSIEANKTELLSTEQLLLKSGMVDLLNADDKTPDVLGYWDIRIMNYLSYLTRKPLTERKTTSFDKVDFPIGLEAIDNSSVRVLPEATLQSQEAGYSRVTYGNKPLYVTILPAKPIGAQIVTRWLTGEAPLGVYAQLSLNDRQEYREIKEIIWETRPVGDSDWRRLEGFAGSPDRILEHYDAGKYELRARTLNKNSNAEFITDTVVVQAYEVPTLTLDGPKNAFVGDIAHMRVTTTDYAGVEIPDSDIHIEWSLDDGDTWVEGTKKLDITRDEEDSISLRVRARYSDAPDERDAWDTALDRVRFRPVRAPRANIHGSRVIEMNNDAEWTVVLVPPYSNMEVDLRGRFTLPDGTVVDGTEATYEPKREDLEKERIYLNYEVWMEGFKDAGAYSQQEKMLSIWEYKWPNWGYYIRQSAAQAPAEISISVRNPAGSTRYIEGLKYEWILPEGVTLISDRFDHTKSFLVEEPGEYKIKTIVSDDRGNETLMERIFSIVEADPWIPEFRIGASDENYHAPLELRLVAGIEGGHPKDRISTYRYYLNDEVFSEGQRYANLELTEGEYEIGLEVETTFGEVERLNKYVTVLPNEQPECSIEVSKSRFGVRFRAWCDDPDGRIESHRWEVDGEDVLVTGSRISLSAREDTHATVRLKGVDNGGLESEWVTWQGSLQGSED